ncbi:hypothetical protein C8R44DRAFT_884898 [Mycena epipterygia]|nr:hypothetical protein C8R44DRAFT_884898 [Mycena epipterygia]
MKMRGLSALPLNNHIVDGILTFCPKFASLEATILVSKAFYRVFQTHPKSIAWAVAYNVVGPAFPQALRVVRFPYPDTDGTLLDLTACPEDRIASILNKDRTSKTSVLSMAESYRFMVYSKIFPGDVYRAAERVREQRSAVLGEYPTDELLELHIVVLFLRGIVKDASGEAPQHYPDFLLAAGPAGALRAYAHRSGNILEDVLPPALLYEDEYNVGERLYAGYFARALDRVWTARGVPPLNEDAVLHTAILDKFHGEKDICSRCATPGGLKLLTEANWTRHALYPDQLLKGHLVDNLALRIPFLSHPAIARINPGSFGGVAIGNQVGGVFVRFQPGPLVGWGEDESGDETEVHYERPDVVDAARVMDRFITRLFADEIRDTRAREVRAAGLVSMNTSIPTTTSGSVPVSGTHEALSNCVRGASPCQECLRRFIVEHADEDFSTWERGDSYCKACLGRLIYEHVWVWFRRERVAAGWVPPEDCWYGYDCRTQMTNARHAETKNHLCVPTKGSVS